MQGRPLIDVLFPDEPPVGHPRTRDMIMAKAKRTDILHCRMKPEEMAMIDHLVTALDTDDRTTLIRRLVKEAYAKSSRKAHPKKSEQSGE